MASILNASLSGGLVATGDTSGIIQLQSNGTQTVNVATNGIITNTFNSANGIVPGYQYYALNSAYTGSTGTTAQSYMGVAPTLSASTIYEFEGLFLLIKTAGATSHTFGVGIGGTATINWMQANWFPGYSVNSTSLAGVNGITALNTFTIAATIASATEYVFISMKGIVSINAGGTFTPQYQLSANPGGAYLAQPGSYFKIAPLAASGSNVSIGSWA